MIKTADKRTAKLLSGQRVPEFQAIERQARRKLDLLNNVERIEELMLQPSNRFEALHGDRNGQYSIRINDKWRICFGFVEGDAYDVEIVDYH